MSYGGATYGGASYAGAGAPPAPPPPGTISDSALTSDSIESDFIGSTAVAETAFTADVVGGPQFAAISENAATADTISGAGIFRLSVTETAHTADAISDLVSNFVAVTCITIVAPTVSARSSFTPPNPQPGPFGFHDYEVIVCNKWGVAYGQITSAVPTEIEWALDDLGEALIDCAILDPSLATLLPMTGTFPGVREIQIWRDQVLIWWGWPTQASYDSKQVHLTCSGLLWPFSVRNFGPVTVNYLNNPQFEAPSSGLPGDVPGWTPVGVAASVINAQENPSQWPVLLGNQALLLNQAEAGVETYVKQDIPVSGGEQGTFFDLSAWVYPLGLGTPAVVEPANNQNGLYINFIADEVLVDTEVQQITVDTPALQWTRLETGIAVPPNVSGVIEVRLYAPQGITIWDAVNLSIEESIGGSPTGSGSDVATIVDLVVNYAQDARFGKSDLAISPCPSINPPGSPPVNEPIGVDLVRVYQFSDNSGILDALNEFPTIAVCDFEIMFDATGHFRQFTTFAPSKGSIKYNFPVEITLKTNTTDLEGTVDGTQAITAARWLGQGSSGSSEDLGYSSFPSFLGGRWVGDGTVTMGSTTITSPTIGFTDADIGEGIYVLTPPGALPICCTIDTVSEDGTSCTFTNNAAIATGSPTPALLDVEEAIVGIGGIIVDNVQSALTDLPISSLAGSAQTALLTQLQGEVLPTARQRADGPQGVFGGAGNNPNAGIQTGDVVPVVYRYGWLTFGPVLMRAVTITLYPPTEELEIQFNPTPILEASYGG